MYGTVATISILQFLPTTTPTTAMTSYHHRRGELHVEEQVDYMQCRQVQQAQQRAAEAHLLRVQRLQKDLRDLSCISDSVSLHTEGTAISSLTGSSGGERRPPHRAIHNNYNYYNMLPPAPYHPILEDAATHVTLSSYISRPIDVDSMQEYDEDADAEAEEEETLKPKRLLALDDSPSRHTADLSFASCSTGPIDVDSLCEYESPPSPHEQQHDHQHDDHHHHQQQQQQQQHDRLVNWDNAHYEAESLLEYSSDDDDSSSLLDNFQKFFDTASPLGTKHVPPTPKVLLEDKAAATATKENYQNTGSRPDTRAAVSVKVMGPIAHWDTGMIVPQQQERRCLEGTTESSLSPFADWQFPILDEREMERELVSYIPGFEPVVEDLPPRPRFRRKPSDAASTRSASSVRSRVTFEI